RHPDVSRAVKNGLGGTRPDPLRCHHRWLSPLSCTPQGGVWEGAASHLPVSSRRRGGESGGGSGGQRPQGPGSHATPTAQRPAEHTSREGGGPHQKTAGSATRRVVRLTISVRPASPEQNRAQDPMARQPWLAPVTRATGSHGPSVCIIRSALSDPDRSGQTGQTAASAPAVPTSGRHPQKALFPYFGKGPDVSGRQTAALHLECGGAGQPALSQDAKECLPGADASADL